MRRGDQREGFVIVLARQPLVREASHLAARCGIAIQTGTADDSAHDWIIARPMARPFVADVPATPADALDGDPVMAELFALNDGLNGLDVQSHAASDAMIWGKFVDLAAFSGVTCLTRSPIGRARAHPPTLDFLLALLRENVAVARAEGFGLPDDHAAQRLAFICGVPETMKSSMLVDLEAGKPLELPWLSGRVCELGARHGIDTPANQPTISDCPSYKRPTQIPVGPTGMQRLPVSFLHRWTAALPVASFPAVPWRGPQQQVKGEVSWSRFT